MNCEHCEGTGWDAVFIHVTFPGHAQGQRHTTVEPFDINRARLWEEAGMVHQLHLGVQPCTCETGKRKRTYLREQRTAGRPKRRPNWSKVTPAAGGNVE